MTASRIEPARRTFGRTIVGPVWFFGQVPIV